MHMSDIVEKLNKEHEQVSDSERRVYQAVCEFLDKRFAPLTNVNQIGAYIVDGPMDDMEEGYLTYPARHELLKTRERVTLKIYRLDTTQPSTKINRKRELFIRDADVVTLLGEIPHDNVVRCYAPFMWESDKLVLPLEWIDGQPLSDLLNGRINWSFEDRLKIFRQIARGLEHVHDLGVIHRAVSPKNVIVTPKQQVKLVNFKYAKVTFQTSVGTITGKPGNLNIFNGIDWRYSAPELRQKPPEATPRTDIFSAGVILFELMTGHRPFPQKTLREQDSLPHPSTINSLLPKGIDDLFLGMCQFKPEARFTSMRDVLQRLSQISI